MKSTKEFSKIRLLSLDVDGILTDGGLYYDENGKELRRFNVHDGLGIKILQKAGIQVCILSQSVTKAIECRAKNLGVKYCFTGIEDKLICMKELLSELNLNFNQVAHVGDDLNDLELLQAVGFSITVPNAVPTILANSKFITERTGGNGAVREIADAILASLNIT